MDPKKFGKNWQKVGNYFKRHWFLGKVVLVKNAQISLEKQFLLYLKM